MREEAVPKVRHFWYPLLLSNEQPIQGKIAAADGAMKRAILLAHYDRDGIIDPYVVAAAREYRKFAHTLVLISVSAKTLPSDLSDTIDIFIPRENIGYDFGSWRAGIEALGAPTNFDEIICVNDSVYGPLFDLAGALDSPAIRDAGYWGMVLSAQESWHVQSWFFSMRSAILQSSTFGEFWRTAGADLPKKELIRPSVRNRCGWCLRREGVAQGDLGRPQRPRHPRRP
jgi:hypothetical protein